MAGTTNLYKVTYHFEISGKKSGPEYVAHVNAAANDFNSIKTVLSNNSLAVKGPGTLVIDDVVNMGAGVAYT